MPLERITSVQNPRVRLARSLQDKKTRERERRFVVDSARDLERALQSGYRVDFLLVCPELVSEHDHTILAMADAPRFEITDSLLEKAGYRQNPTGIVAVLFTRPARTLGSIENDGEPVLVLVSLEKPGNIGALLRTADATGIRQVLLVDTLLDRYNPNLIRASTGAIFLDTCIVASADDALAFLKSRSYSIISAHLNGTSTLFNVPLTGRTAIVLGQEDRGLSQRWVDECTHLLRIPMIGTLTDSLNVSVSGAVILYEALRQRLSQP